MNAPKLVIDDKKVQYHIHLGFGILMVLFSTVRFLFEPPSTAMIVITISFSFQGILFIFLGSSFRKIILQRDDGQLKIRWSHTFSKKAFSDNWINEIFVGNAYLFIKPTQGDIYKHRIDFLKPQNRQAIIEFLQSHFPNKLKFKKYQS